jgi:hypothetical protein
MKPKMSNQGYQSRQASHHLIHDMRWLQLTSIWIEQI